MAIFTGDNNFIDASQIGGSISFKMPDYTPGQTGAINGGYNFDLPLASVAEFQNSALAFSVANTNNAQGFLQTALTRSSAAVGATSDRAMTLSENSVASLQQMHGELMGTMRYISKRNSGLGCFITTAICGNDDKPDDCYELETLRDYRDNYLAKQPDGEKLISEYYEIAPGIVARINAKYNSTELWATLRDKYLAHALDAIEWGDMERAKTIYIEMVKAAEKLAE